MDNVISVTDKRERKADKIGWVGLPPRRALYSKLRTPQRQIYISRIAPESLDLGQSIPRGYS